MTETHEVRMPSGMLITDVTQQRTSTSMASNARTLTLGAVWMSVPDYWTEGYLFKTITCLRGGVPSILGGTRTDRMRFGNL